MNHAHKAPIPPPWKGHFSMIGTNFGSPARTPYQIQGQPHQGCHCLSTSCPQADLREHLSELASSMSLRAKLNCCQVPPSLGEDGGTRSLLKISVGVPEGHLCFMAMYSLICTAVGGQVWSLMGSSHQTMAVVTRHTTASISSLDHNATTGSVTNTTVHLWGVAVPC